MCVTRSTQCGFPLPNCLRVGRTVIASPGPPPRPTHTGPPRYGHRMATETPPAPVADAPKLSPVEGIKNRSRYLRGSLAEEVASDADHLSEEAKNILKFHGSYQQEDRDARKNRSKAGVGKAYMFMIRLKLPGGRLTAGQYLAMDDICHRHANGTLRCTTRQSLQLHGLLKAHLKQTIADINGVMVSTLGACGDVNRNVV